MNVCGIPVEFDATSTRVAEACGFWPRKRIVVGRAWYGLTGEERVAVLFHEAGHCKAFHLELRILMLPLLLIAPPLAAWICRRQELACDRFAARAGFGDELVGMLERIHAEDNLFYPSHAERARSIKEYLQGEELCSSES